MSNSNICIICGQPIEEESIEHVIPEALGGKIKIDTVCNKCNSQLGDKVDGKLTNSMLFEWIRHELKIKNRDGKVPTLYKYYRDDDGKPIVIMHGDGKNKPEIYTGDGKPVFEILKGTDNSASVVKFSGADEEAIIQRGIREFKRKGLQVSDTVVRSIVLAGIKREWHEIHVEFDIKYEPRKYVPCFVKIAYETMRSLFPEYKLDSYSEKLRVYLLSWIKDSPDKDFLYDEILADHSSGAPINTYYAYFSIRGGKLYIDIVLFNKVTMCIPVSDNPSRYYFGSNKDSELFQLLVSRINTRGLRKEIGEAVDRS